MDTVITFICAGQIDGSTWEDLVAKKFGRNFTIYADPNITEISAERSDDGWIDMKIPGAELKKTAVISAIEDYIGARVHIIEYKTCMAR